MRDYTIGCCFAFCSFSLLVQLVRSVTCADIRNHVELFGIRVLLDRNMLCWTRGMKLAC